MPLESPHFAKPLTLNELNLLPQYATCKHSFLIEYYNWLEETISKTSEKKHQKDKKLLQNGLLVLQQIKH